jgi:hypothetical protein
MKSEGKELFSQRNTAFETFKISRNTRRFLITPNLHTLRFGFIRNDMSNMGGWGKKRRAAESYYEI